MDEAEKLVMTTAGDYKDQLQHYSWLKEEKMLKGISTTQEGQIGCIAGVTLFFSKWSA